MSGHIPAATAGELTASPARRAELAANLAEVRARIDAACAEAGREPGEVRLVAVTKTFPASDAAALAGLGQLDLGENRDQEAAPKAAALRAAGIGATWHYIGQLQRNKAKSVAAYAGLVQSVDRPQLVKALADAAGRLGREPLGVLLQLSLDGDTERGGVAGADLDALVDSVTSRPELALRGVMAVAPLGWAPDKAFEQVAALSERVRRTVPEAVEISAGMSGDFTRAIVFGATLVRIGAILLGSRSDLG
ncbi:YggS family pyridoxal phosphate enzyme [Actinorhabdospora filicis]|uniref:Pyridoxal phosphate homeostasis protein n=1 Tax=Actinorhabdospora filicis TaxID=1785913 RepID=A0A9W6W107_9ACTN|nr:YggS family pyridoxal phosphate-dependent enzyme [Actinorhabdospora filicis]GLZ75367.1 YggS family pyridoxal phosphate enzyme [Actinorhabdospora filicis]